MARSRNIKPSFFTNDILADCSPLARILFAGLWTIADRDGRLQDRPKKIKAEILPYDNCDVDDLLTDLDDKGFIIRYDVEEVDYIQIVSFKKHQNPHQKEQPSTIPAPCKSGAKPKRIQVEPCLNPQPESPIPHPSPKAMDQDVFPFEGADQSADGLFQIFWHDYPDVKTKGDRKEARTKFLKLIKDGESYAKIIDGTRRYAQFCNETGAYNKYASTFLNAKERRWLGEWEPGRGRPPSAGGIASNAQALAEGIRRTMRDDGGEVEDPASGGIQTISPDE